ncbi:MAG: exo-alpha-sialidase [Thermodesulfobacteriota bacterium]|nr:exo-alpha-sialidase [Thermodesulfobacteriota bacterium]
MKKGIFFLILFSFLGLLWSGSAVALDDFAPSSVNTTPFFPSVMGLALPADGVTDNVQVNDVSIGQQHQPDMAVTSDGIIYVVWRDFRDDPGGKQGDIYFAKSTNGGLTFSAGVCVNDDSGTTPHCAPMLTTDNQGNVYVVWHDNRNGNWDIYFAKSTDGGDHFDPNVQIVNDPDTQYEAALAIDNDGNIYVTWIHSYSTGIYNDFDIYFAKSTDEGQTFTTPVMVNDVGDGYQYTANIRVDESGIIYVVWTDHRNGWSNIYFAKSTDGGENFSENVRVNSTDYGQGYPDLALDDTENIYVVWKDLRDHYSSNTTQVYLAKSTDNGASFEAGVRVNNANITRLLIYLYPSLAVTGDGEIYVSWWDNRNDNLDVYLTHSYDGGISFSPSRRMNDDINNASQDQSRIVVDESGDIYGVWSDYRNLYNSPDIYFAHFSPCEGDFNDDGDVDGADLAIFAADFGRTDCSGDCEGDFNNDGDVDRADLAIFAADFGRTDCP